MPDFKLTEKQIEALSIISGHTETLMDGGSRSGKTFLAIWILILISQKYPNTKQLATRLHLNHIKTSIVNDTFPKIMKMAFPAIEYEINKTDLIATFDNDSQILFLGLDDKNRTEKILGTEFSTIFMNEASQISFSAYEMVKTRLNPPAGVHGRILIDYNPPSTNHWGYKQFILGVNPNTGQKHKNPERYGRILMNPTDNIQNLSQDYIDTLDSLSEAQRNRFLFGRYSDASENALWRPEWIYDNRWTGVLPTISRIIVAVDPAVTSGVNSDNTGIIIVGSGFVNGERHYFVFDDRTSSLGVVEWGREVIEAYRGFQCDCIVAESNQGGDLVEMNIRNYDRTAPVKLVRATRGKAVRASPVADLYRRGLVHHVKEFPELEEQLVTWSEDSGYSPDNLDALVWGITHLAEISGNGSPLFFSL